MCDAVVRGDTSRKSLGKRMVLPAIFTGGPRYMIQNYHDAMAICRWAGNPDLFITFTANPKWLEMQSFLDEIPGQNPQHRPDIETRVFKIKLDQLMKDIVQGEQFGRVIAGMMKIKLLSNKNPSKGLPFDGVNPCLFSPNSPIPYIHLLPYAYWILLLITIICVLSSESA